MAVMLCGPTARVAVENVAVPAVSVPDPSVVAPSLKVTEPVAVDGDMVAVNVTLAPNAGEAFDVDRPVVVTICCTETDTADDVDVALFVSPP